MEHMSALCLGDGTAVKTGKEVIINPETQKIGSGDTHFFPHFLNEDDATKAFIALNETETQNWQQWFHMPSKDKEGILPLSRLKFAMADTNSDGWIPHYRFPVNNQDKHGIFPFAHSPTVDKIRKQLIEFTGIPFNHAVVLLYRDGKDCIGFHQDKTLDLSPTYPIASVSLGQEREYILRDNIFTPKMSQELKLVSGSLLLLGAETNKKWYHSVPMNESYTAPRISITFRVVTTYKNSLTGELRGQGATFPELNWPQKLGGKHIEYPDYNQILDFWFGVEKTEYRSGLWWYGISPELKEVNSLETADAYITSKWAKFFDLYPTDDVIDLFKDSHYLKQWMDTIDGTMALIILFDQFSRHVFRGTARSYAYDVYAQVLANHISKNETMPTVYKIFIYVALMHSEELSVVIDSNIEIMKLADNETCDKMKFKLKKLVSISNQHVAILKKFGRYPHRNVVLGREKTVDEINYLTTQILPRWMKTSLPAIAKSEAMEGIKKLKVLVLHSNRQTAQAFKNKTSKYLEKKLQSFVDITYGEAPKLYQPAGEAEETIKKNDYDDVPNVGFTRAWWNATDDPKTMVYRGLEQSLEYIDSLFKTNDFDGIIGFSQGGTLAGIVAALVNDHRKGKSVYPLKYVSAKLRFVAIISGFYCRDTRPEFINCILEEQPTDHFPELVKVRKELIDIPSFHSWGMTDTLVNPWRSQKLSEAFSNKIVHVHPSGHFIKAIKYWPVDELFMWLRQMVIADIAPPDYIQMATQMIEHNTVNHTNVEKYRSVDPESMQMSINHIIFSRMCDMNTLYELLHNLFGTDDIINEKLVNIMRQNYEVIEHLLHLDTKNKNDNMRTILVNMLTNEMVKEYKTYVIDKSDGFPSKLSKYLPNRNVLYCESGLFKDLATKLASLINTYDMTQSSINDTDEKRQKLQSYTQYRRMVAALRNLVTKSIPKIIPKKYVPSKVSLKTLLDRPISDYILNPRAEPVDVSPAYLLEPLYNFLETGHSEKMEMTEDNDMSFEKGTICKDGRLDLCKQVIGTTGVKELIRSLAADSSKEKPLVKHLLLGNNICGNDLGIEIAKFIKSGKSSLTTWYIAGNNMNEKGLEPLCEALKTDTQVKQLWLKRNPLFVEGVKPIADMMHYNTHLQILDLTNTGIGDEGALIILNNLSKYITHLYLGANGLTSKTCEFIANMIHTTGLESISLGCNRLTSEGAKFIAQALIHPECKLKALEIASAGIGPEGAKYIADALKVNTSLIWLNMGFLKSTNDLGEVPNIIESDGAIYLAEGLAANVTLRGLDLTYTGIQQTGIAALADVLEKNTQMIYFNIEQFGIPHNELSREIIRRTMQKNKEIIPEDELKYVTGIIDPPHLEEIKSVYRIQ